MRALSKLKLPLIIVLSVFMFVSCSDDDDATPVVPPTQTITELAVSNTDLTTLVTALQRVGLDTTLSGAGPFTVFAPTNAAFAQLLTDLGATSLDDVDDATLENILLNHVISGSFQSGALTTGYGNTLATNADGDALSIYIDTTSGVSLNGIADVTGADNLASNGVVHVVNAVITLPTIVDFATSNPALSNLVAAVQSADSQDPSPDLIGTLSGATVFTVFAPTDDAFAALLLELDDTGMTGLGDLDPAVVEDVLLIHVVSGNIRSTDLTDDTVMTLGGDITIDATNLTITDPNLREIGIIASLVDIQGINGVVHAVDRVIRPAAE